MKTHYQTLKVKPYDTNDTIKKAYNRKWDFDPQGGANVYRTAFLALQYSRNRIAYDMQSLFYLYTFYLSKKGYAFYRLTKVIETEIHSRRFPIEQVKTLAEKEVAFKQQALFYTCYSDEGDGDGNLQLLRMLLEAGADVNDQDTVPGRPPLLLALDASNGRFKEKHYELVKSGADPDIGYEDWTVRERYEGRKLFEQALKERN